MEEILSSIRRIIADEEAEDGPSDDDDLGAAEAESEALNEDAEALARAAEDEDPDDVLELTRVVRDSGEVVELRAEGSGGAALADALSEAAAAHGEPATADDEVELTALDEATYPAPGATPSEPFKQEDQPAVETKSATIRPELVSATVASAASGAFAKLTEAFQHTPPEESVADGSGRTVEQFIEDMVRPLLKQWLDDNLPPIVERLVQKEIQKIARRAEII
jgi:cell pole-organizing protein PopZ